MKRRKFRKYKNRIKKDKINLFDNLNRYLILLMVFMGSLTINKINPNHFFSLTSLKESINEHSNIIIYTQNFFIDILDNDSTIEVDRDLSRYKDVEDIEDGILVRDDFNQTILNIKEGIVVKNNSDEITIKGMDGLDYYYTKVVDVNVKLYQYVKVGDILGISLYNEEIQKNEYIIRIKDRSDFLNVREVIGID